MRSVKLLFILLFVSAFMATAQDGGISIEKITVINLGDGKILHRELESEKPLEGEHRLINGFQSSYIQAQFKGGLYHGDYKFYKNNKLVTEGVYIEGVGNGLFKDYYGDGETVKTERKLKNGKVDGIVKNYDQQGRVEYEKEYKEGVEHGIERRYRDGELAIDCNYADGKKHGKQVENLISNRGDYVKKSEYDMGVQVGEYSEELEEEGVTTVKGNYEKGKKDGKWVHKRRDDTLEKEIEYKDGVQDGLTIVYFTDGTPEKKSEYSKGKLNGATTTYDWKSGNVKSEYNYKDGKKEGEYRLYYEDGTLREEGRCENDRDVYRKEFDKKGKITSVKERTRTGWETIQ